MKKTNIFKVKEKENKRILIEEERLNKIPFLYPFILFFKKNKKFVVMSLVMIALSLILISVGIAFSLFRGTNDYEITYITGSEEIGANTDPEIDDEDIEEELLGEIAREQGVVILVESFLTSKGDVIYYYTDSTSVMVTAGGKIYRISPDENGHYGVNRNGKIDDTAKKVLVTSTTNSLSDGSIITYYSDGTAMVEFNNEIIFVRDSNNVVLSDGKLFNRTKPSGVALNSNTTPINNGKVNKFSDGTTLVTIGGDMFIINKNSNVDIQNNRISYDRNNIFSVISEKKYSDGNIIRHFSNGSATITDEEGNVIFVRSSGDLVLKKKKLYEIMPNSKANSRGFVKGANGTNVIYFDNGAAVIIDSNNNRQYVEDADSITYDNRKNISSDVDFSKLLGTMITDDGKKAYSFANGKTQVINTNNSSYIVDTNTITLKPMEEEKDEATDSEDDSSEQDKEEEKDEGTTQVPVDPAEGIYITEAEHEYQDPLDIQSTTFVIKNDSMTNKVIRIVIEEVSDYSKYNTSRLEPKFVKFQSTVGDDYVPASHLTDNTWVDEANGTDNYIIYDGVIKAKSTVTVALSLYVDYSMLDNSHQNKGFIGTIKVYADA